MKVLKYAPAVAGALLGLLFIASGLVVLLKLVPMPPIPPGTPPALFMEAMGPTGYLTFIKVMEVIGGVLVAIPRTRNLGLLVLGPIIVNILAYHAFVMDGVGVFSAPVILVSVLALGLLWCGRREFAGLINRRPSQSLPT